MNHTVFHIANYWETRKKNLTQYILFRPLAFVFEKSAWETENQLFLAVACRHYRWYHCIFNLLRYIKREITVRDLHSLLYLELEDIIKVQDIIECVFFVVYIVR